MRITDITADTLYEKFPNFRKECSEDDECQIQNETVSGAIASIAGGLGGGDPNASIYAPLKKKKMTVIKRTKMENNDDNQTI